MDYFNRQKFISQRGMYAMKGTIKIDHHDIAAVEKILDCLVDNHGYSIYSPVLDNAHRFIQKMYNAVENVCDCRDEWLVHHKELDTYPYGWDVEYDECNKCGERHNFRTI